MMVIGEREMTMCERGLGLASLRLQLSFLLHNNNYYY
jgi:hypothetical protein